MNPRIKFIVVAIALSIVAGYPAYADVFGINGGNDFGKDGMNAIAYGLFALAGSIAFAGYFIGKNLGNRN